MDEYSEQVEVAHNKGLETQIQNANPNVAAVLWSAADSGTIIECLNPIGEIQGGNETMLAHCHDSITPSTVGEIRAEGTLVSPTSVASPDKNEPGPDGDDGKRRDAGLNSKEKIVEVDMAEEDTKEPTVVEVEDLSGNIEEGEPAGRVDSGEKNGSIAQIQTSVEMEHGGGGKWGLTMDTETLAESRELVAGMEESLRDGMEDCQRDESQIETKRDGMDASHSEAGIEDGDKEGVALVLETSSSTPEEGMCNSDEPSR